MLNNCFVAQAHVHWWTGSRRQQLGRVSHDTSFGVRRAEDRVSHDTEYRVRRVGDTVSHDTEFVVRGRDQFTN